MRCRWATGSEKRESERGKKKARIVRIRPSFSFALNSKIRFVLSVGLFCHGFSFVLLSNQSSFTSCPSSTISHYSHRTIEDRPGIKKSTSLLPPSSTGNSVECNHFVWRCLPLRQWLILLPSPRLKQKAGTLFLSLWGVTVATPMVSLTSH